MTSSGAPHGSTRSMKHFPFGIGTHCHRTPGVGRLGRARGLRLLGFHEDIWQCSQLGLVSRLENPLSEIEILVERRCVLKQILVLQTLVRRHDGAQFTE